MRAFWARHVSSALAATQRDEYVAATGAVPVVLGGDKETDAAALARALEESAPSLVLDFVWGSPAEAAFRALGRHGLDEDSADIAYVQIGALAGPEAALPAALLRSRRIRVSGSGAGSASRAALIAEPPRLHAADRRGSGEHSDAHVSALSRHRSMDCRC